MTYKSTKVWFEDGRIILLTCDGCVGSLPVQGAVGRGSLTDTARWRAKISGGSMRRECKLPVEHSLAPQDVNMEGVRISGSSDIILCNLLQMVEKDATFGFIRTSIYSEFQDSRLLNCNCILI